MPSDFLTHAQRQEQLDVLDATMRRITREREEAARAKEEQA